MLTRYILSSFIALSLLLAACSTNTPQQPTAISLSPTPTTTPIPPTPTLSPEEQQKIILENKIKRHLTALGMTTCNNCTIKTLPNSSTEALVQKIVDKDGKEQEIILSAIGIDGKEMPYKLWKMQAQSIAGTMLDGTKVVDGKGLISHNWDNIKQEWAVDLQYRINSFEIPSEHADYFWFNQHLSSTVINFGNGKVEEFLNAQMNCFPISRKQEIEAKSGVQMLFVDCIIQTLTGKKRQVTLIFQRLAIWENPGLSLSSGVADATTNDVLHGLIDTAIRDKKQIGVDIIVGHKPIAIEKAVCNTNCAFIALASNQSSRSLLDFYLSAGEKSEEIKTLAVQGIYKSTQEKEDFMGKDVPNLRRLLSLDGYPMPPEK